MPESKEPLPSLEALQLRINKADTQSGLAGKGEADTAQTKGMSQAMGMAWSMVSGASVGTIGGYFLDERLHISPVCLITGFFLGFAGGLYALMQQVKKDDASNT